MKGLIGDTALGNTFARRLIPANALRSKLALALGYLALYLLLDRLSSFQSMGGIDITPWNPQRGLAFALLIVKGWSYVPLAAFATLLASQLLPSVHVSLTTAVPSALFVACVYAAGAAVLRHWLGSEARLTRARDVVALIVIATVSAAIVVFGFVAIYIAGGVIAAGNFGEAFFQLWIGDAIGAVVVTPIVLLMVEHAPRSLRPMLGRSWLAHLEAAGQWLSIGTALFLVFGLGNNRYTFQLFYLLFLPLVWIAARRGLRGASWAVLMIQAGLIAALEFGARSTETIRTFQLLMFAVATTGLMLGAAVTERRRAVLALVESENRLAAIVSTARDGVLMIDSRGFIESVNPAVERLFAQPARLLVGHDFRQLIDAPKPLESLAPSTQAEVTETAPWSLQGKRADGSAFPIELTAGQFGAVGDEHYTLVVRDVTSRRNAEMRVRVHETELAQESRFSLADEMATAMAHELNQPLTAIATFARGCLHLIKEPRSELNLIQEGIEHVVQQAERAGDIIERLRDLVRTGMCQRSAVDVRVMLDAALALIETEASQSKVDMTLCVPPDLAPVMADRIQIEQVLVNLLRNAVDATASAGAIDRKVVVTVQPAETDHMEITVADSGFGVSEEVAARLFEPFMTTKPNGMGLGLSISRSIIDAHGGRLELVRSSDSGAVFGFVLPISKGES